MMRKTNEQSLKEVIDELLDAYKLKDKLQHHKVIHSWEKIMGKAVASRTREIFIKDKKLCIRLTSSSLKHEFTFLRQEIIDRVNEEAGEEVINQVVLL